MESRVHREVYARFGRGSVQTCCRKTVRRHIATSRAPVKGNVYSSFGYYTAQQSGSQPALPMTGNRTREHSTAGKRVTPKGYEASRPAMTR